MNRWILMGVMAVAGSLSAHERMWTFVYDTDPVPKGLVEIEPWVTYTEGREGLLDYWAWRTRLEFEYALTPALTMAFYLNSSQTVRVDSAGGPATSTAFDGISFVAFQRFTNPRTDLVGTGLYLEVTHDGEKTALEEKLILSRWLGDRINMALNLVVEQEWEKAWENTGAAWEARREKEAVLSVAGAISRMVSPATAVGLEIYTHTEWAGKLFPGGGAEHTAIFVGPSFHYSAARFWATLTVLPQITGVLDEHTRVMIRTILGVTF